MISVDGLRKVYGDFVAVHGSSFDVAPGEIFGVVGPNGAGKTTTLKTLAGLVEPTAGAVRVAGEPAGDPGTRTALGYLPEESPLYEDMTPRSYLRFFADLYEVPREVADRRIESTLDDLELEHRDRRLGDTSKGMKRKVAIARSLVNDPDVLVYDEPASGLDPLTTNYVLEYVRALADAGRTVLFSAHNLHHVESVCDRVVIMNEGRIVARGTVEAIRAEHGETSYRVFTTVPVEGSEPVAEGGTGDASGERGGADDADERTGDATGERVSGDGSDGRRHRATVGSMAEVEALRAEAEAAGGRVVDIRTRESTLEEIFLDVAGEPTPGSRRVAPGEGPTARDADAADDGRGGGASDRGRGRDDEGGTAGGRDSGADGSEPAGGEGDEVAVGEPPEAAE